MGQMEIATITSVVFLAGMAIATICVNYEQQKDDENLGIYMHGIRQTCHSLSGSTKT